MLQGQGLASGPSPHPPSFQPGPSKRGAMHTRFSTLLPTPAKLPFYRHKNRAPPAEPRTCAHKFPVHSFHNSPPGTPTGLAVGGGKAIQHLPWLSWAASTWRCTLRLGLTPQVDSQKTLLQGPTPVLSAQCPGLPLSSTRPQGSPKRSLAAGARGMYAWGGGERRVSSIPLQSF